jgi:hypothetical protein
MDMDDETMANLVWIEKGQYSAEADGEDLNANLELDIDQNTNGMRIEAILQLSCDNEYNSVQGRLTYQLMCLCDTLDVEVEKRPVIEFRQFKNRNSPARKMTAALTIHPDAHSLCVHLCNTKFTIKPSPKDEGAFLPMQVQFGAGNQPGVIRIRANLPSGHYASGTSIAKAIIGKSSTEHFPLFLMAAVPFSHRDHHGLLTDNKMKFEVTIVYDVSGCENPAEAQLFVANNILPVLMVKVPTTTSLPMGNQMAIAAARRKQTASASGGSSSKSKELYASPTKGTKKRRGSSHGPLPATGVKECFIMLYCDLWVCLPGCPRGTHTPGAVVAMAALLKDKSTLHYPKKDNYLGCKDPVAATKFHLAEQLAAAFSTTNVTE